MARLAIALLVKVRSQVYYTEVLYMEGWCGAASFTIWSLEVRYINDISLKVTIYEES